MSCIAEYSGLEGCISRCVDVTFQNADEIMSRVRGGHSFSYNGYKPDDLITEKYLELADKLEKNGQDNFVDRLVDITSNILSPCFTSGDHQDIENGCSVLGVIYDIIAGPLEVQINLNKAEKLIKELNQAKTVLSEQVNKLTQENSECNNERAILQKKSEQVNKLTQENDECNNERAILQKKIDSITSNIDHSGTGLAGKIKTIIEEKNKCQEERSVLEKSNLDLQNEVSSLKDLLLQGTFPALSDELSLFYSAHEMI